MPDWQMQDWHMQDQIGFVKQPQHVWQTLIVCGIQFFEWEV
jgi:hypothetical protein